MLRECLWIAAHYRDTETVLTRQFRLLAVLLYLGGYFPKGMSTVCSRRNVSFY